jgi:type I restriction enzyme, S subunit
MNNETITLLEKHFDVAFAAPDGIKKLRELILMLAMQGKLVPQDPNDQPASELLKEIEAEKKRLVKDGKIKPSKPLLEIRSEELPYELPMSWEWMTLEKLASKIGSGSTPRGGKEVYEIEGIPFLRSQNIWDDGLRLDDVAFISEDTHGKMNATKVIPMDILLNITGASIGRCAIIPDNFGEANVSQHVTIIRCINPEIRRFIHFVLLSPFGQSMIWTRQVGMSREGLSKKVLDQFQIPLPPLAEQRRIVAKIDELMARCDELEKLRGDRHYSLTTVHTAALNRLLMAKESSDFSTAWSFITQHFGELYSSKENVAELRKAILQLAVMGKLVPQDLNDEPASELLKAIVVEKQRLVKEGRIKQPKLSPDIKLEEMPYELPKGWEWVRLGEISLFSDSGWSPQCLSEPRTGQEWGVLKVSAVSWGEFRPEENKALPPGVEAKPECEIRVGDFLISRANTEELVARSVIVKISPIHLMMSDKIVRFNLSQKVEKDFINLANLSRFSREYYARNASGTSSSMKNISREVMNSLPISIPPLAEQNRIVAKIDQLMGLCDRLEQQIDNATSKQNALLNVVMTKL